MSLKIIKSGILDTIQDHGRFGYQHLGINPGGAMDVYSFYLSNALLGKELNSASIEIHFPSLQILFEQETIICITGGDFAAEINGKRIAHSQPVAVYKNSLLTFPECISGARSYISFLHDLDIEPWLKSFSTNLKAKKGGYQGRRLQKNDQLNFKNENIVAYNFKDTGSVNLSWGVINRNESASSVIRCIKGSEWRQLDIESMQTFKTEPFAISQSADRMGYRLKGASLTLQEPSMVSSPVTFGTIQLLPDGQMIILMADHQTTGGYPRIAHVIEADLPLLAQKKPSDNLYFEIIDVASAEHILIKRKQHLKRLQSLCNIKMKKLFE